jgi:hypothetical protein
MKELVLYYSYTGHVAAIAEDFAKDKGFDCCRVVTEKIISKFEAYTAGCLKSMRGSGYAINSLVFADCGKVDLSAYDTVYVFAPVWANNLAAPINNALKELPKGTKVRIVAVSAGGKSGKEKIVKRVNALGLNVTGFADKKASG